MGINEPWPVHFVMESGKSAFDKYSPRGSPGGGILTLSAAKL